MKPLVRNVVLILLLLGTSSGCAAAEKTRTPQQAQDADLMIDSLDSWRKISEMSRRFSQCDDGSIAEGNSEAVARLLVDKWSTLPQLLKLTKINPGLRRFVVRHIDETLDTGDLEHIQMLSLSSCPRKMASFCHEINQASNRALTPLAKR